MGHPMSDRQRNAPADRENQQVERPIGAERDGFEELVTAKLTNQTVENQPQHNTIGRDKPSAREIHQGMPRHEGHQDDESVDITAVDVGPEDDQRHDQPDVQDVAIARQGEDQDQDRREQIREARGSDIEERSPDEQSETDGNHPQSSVHSVDPGGSVQGDCRKEVEGKLPVDQGVIVGVGHRPQGRCQLVEDHMSQPILIHPAGRMPVPNGVESDLVGDPPSPTRPGRDLFRRRPGLVGIGAERLDRVDTVVDEMSSAGHSDPGVPRRHHVGAGMKGEEQHGHPADHHRPAGKGFSIKPAQCLTGDRTFVCAHSRAFQKSRQIIPGRIRLFP